MSNLARSILIGCLLWPALVGAADEFLRVRPGKKISFPEAHGAHPSYPTEWWYTTGHLTAESGQTFGFELTFFRVGVNRETQTSSFHVPSLYMAHFAVTDDREKRLLFDERLTRPSFKGAGAEEGRLDVWNDGWRLREEGEEIVLSASGIDHRSGKSFALELELESKKTPALHGDQGFSQKGPFDGQASYYYSLTKLLGGGELSLGTQTFSVQSRAWLDHEVVSFNPDGEEFGWDWFSVQLSNGEEIMLFHLRDTVGNITEFSSGSFIKADGEVIPLTRSQFLIEVEDTWKSERTKIRYPSGWKISIPQFVLNIQIQPTVLDQEIVGTASTGMIYWEGRSLVSGTREGTPVHGESYVELVGYGEEA